MVESKYPPRRTPAGNIRSTACVDRALDLDRVGEVLDMIGIRKRTKAGKAILAALEQVYSNLSWGDRSALGLQKGVSAGHSFAILRGILRRFGYADLIPEQSPRVIRDATIQKIRSR